jgi:hypothetical protein
MANNANSARGLENIHKDDPVMQALMRGESWANAIEKGDPTYYNYKPGEVLNTNMNAPRSLPSWARDLDPYFQDRIRQMLDWESDDSYLGSGWSVPDLRMRKAIWENFPVVLTPLESGNGTERYAISWHKKHLEDWREDMDRALSSNEHQDYDIFSEYKLLYALAMHSRQYRIEVPKNDDQIAILAMRHSGTRRNNRAANNRTVNNRANNRKNNRTMNRANNRKNNRARNNKTMKNMRNVPVLRKLVDIKDYFPVTWSEVPGKAGTKTYALQLHNKKLMDMSAAAGRNIRAELSQKLMGALRASTFWNVLPGGTAGEFARLEMRTR